MTNKVPFISDIKFTIDDGRFKKLENGSRSWCEITWDLADERCRKLAEARHGSDGKLIYDAYAVTFIREGDGAMITLKYAGMKFTGWATQSSEAFILCGTPVLISAGPAPLRLAQKEEPPAVAEAEADQNENEKPE